MGLEKLGNIGNQIGWGRHGGGGIKPVAAGPEAADLRIREVRDDNGVGGVLRRDLGEDKEATVLEFELRKTFEVVDQAEGFVGETCLPGGFGVLF